ncbi:cytochrome b6-F complex iron-sulfur subunit [Candidatus Magnetoovum chiemensis]|nr:cytochrome b6-F complex iron-sulfur subunit [Candidatus Magnetoovum chiemensis]
MNRRLFLKKLVKLLFYTLISSASVISFIFLYPSKIKKRQLTFFDIMDEDMLPKQGVKQHTINYKTEKHDTTITIYIITNNDNTYALSPICSHLGCIVYYNKNKELFICPCHKGQYDIAGNVIKGPPPKLLKSLPMQIKNGRVFVAINT